MIWTGPVPKQPGTFSDISVFCKKAFGSRIPWLFPRLTIVVVIISVLNLRDILSIAHVQLWSQLSTGKPAGYYGDSTIDQGAGWTYAGRR
jgi:hypothetical protein